MWFTFDANLDDDDQKTKEHPLYSYLYFDTKYGVTYYCYYEDKDIIIVIYSNIITDFIAPELKHFKREDGNDKWVINIENIDDIINNKIINGDYDEIKGKKRIKLEQSDF